MRVHVLRSPTGGGRRSRRRTNLLLENLRSHGDAVVDLTGGSGKESSIRLRAAIDDGSIERVLVAGGDGLVHLAIQDLAGTGIPVTIDPTGTGNDFAAALALQPATRDSIAATPRAVDLIRATTADGRTVWVASIAIAGFPADINDRANRLWLPIGSQIYTVAAALELPRFRRRALALRLDGDPLEVDSAMLAIGNTKLFGGGMLACPDAHPEDGLLHLTSINDVGRRGILRHLIGRAGGTADRPEVLRRSARRIDVESEAIPFWGDGESIGLSPLRLEVVPGALQIAGYDNA